MTETLLQVSDLTCLKEKGTHIFSKVNFEVNEGDIVIVQGKSGSGCAIHISFDIPANNK